MGKREVHMLTTLHEPVMIETGMSHSETGRRIEKPLCIAQFNVNMRAADQADMQNSFSECLRKTIKGYKKLFFRLFDIAVQNSYSVYNVEWKNS